LKGSAHDGNIMMVKIVMRSSRRARVPLPRGVLVDVLRHLAGQLSPTGATMPSGGRSVVLLCPVIEHELLGMGMKVKGLKLRQPSFNLHYARILYAFMAAGADKVFDLHISIHNGAPPDPNSISSQSIDAPAAATSYLPL
jgi:hypothetical protein